MLDSRSYHLLRWFAGITGIAVVSALVLYLLPETEVIQRVIGHAVLGVMYIVFIITAMASTFLLLKFIFHLAAKRDPRERELHIKEIPNDEEKREIIGYAVDKRRASKSL